MVVEIVIPGSHGRMGSSIVACAMKDAAVKILAKVERGESIGKTLKKGSVIIDFTHHTATPEFVAAAVKAQAGMVIGTTGFSDSELKKISKAAKVIPIVLAPNMSVGVNLLFCLSQLVATTLKEDFDVEIIEKHHRRKKDSPSGTAVRIAEVIATAKGLNLRKAARYGRCGDVGERTSSEIGIHAVRGGDYIGEHTVLFAGEGETVEIGHRASDRNIFARGAVLAAKWVARAKPGLYNMQDVLGLRKL